MVKSELRDKEEITREIEESRQEVKDALRMTQQTWTGHNPAIRAWEATKVRALKTKQAVVGKACSADVAIRQNIYRSLGIAAVIGAAVGLLTKSRFKKARARRCC